MKIKVTEENAKLGIKVIRGLDWKWGNQDIDYNGKHMSGIIIDINKGLSKNILASVKWENGTLEQYRIGSESYDLYLVPKNSQTEFEF